MQQAIQLQNHDISQSWQPPRLKSQKSGGRTRGRVLYQQVERGQHRGATEPLSLTLEARAIVTQDVPPAAHAELGVCCYATGALESMEIPSNFPALIEVPEPQIVIGREGSGLRRANPCSGREGGGILNLAQHSNPLESFVTTDV